LKSAGNLFPTFGLPAGGMMVTCPRQIGYRTEGDSLMEPRNDLSAQTPDSTDEKKRQKSRFQIVKLEERIAPSKGGIPGKTNGSCYCYKGTKNCGH
jgi:hypothetical protein